MKFLFKGVSLLAISSILSRLLGVLRDHMLANVFGATAGQGLFDLDVYYAAFRLPDLLYNLLIFGAVSAVFVPIFAEKIEKNDYENAWQLVSIILNFMCLALIFISGIVFLIAPWLMPVLVPGFSQEKIDLTVQLMRIMLISPLFFGVASLAQSIQNVFHKFFYYSLAPIFYNLGIIWGIIYLSDRFGVYGVAAGVILGAFLQMIVQLPAVFFLGYRYQWIWNYKRDDVRKMFKLFIPRLFGGAVGPLTFIVETFVASFLMSGSLTILNYAFNLQSLPMGVIGLSFAIASFGSLSRLASRKNQNEFFLQIRGIISKISFFIIPASIGLFLLRSEVVYLILGSGRFMESDRFLTAQTLGIFCFGLIFSSVLPLLIRSFYALNNTRLPVVVGLFGIAVSFIVSYLAAVYYQFGVFGIAFGNIISTAFQFFVLLFFLNSYAKNAPKLIDLSSIAVYIFSAAFMGCVVFYLRSSLQFTSSGILLEALKLLLLSAIGALVYFSVFYTCRRLFRD